MKKILIIIFVFLTLFFIYNINNKEHEPVVLKEKTVFNIDEYNIFYLDLSEEDITTLDLDLFSKMDIISIDLYVNPLYRDKIGIIKYKYQNISLKRNVNNMTNYYINEIRNSGIMDEFNYISVTGIKIDKIEVYSKGDYIINLIEKKRKIKYLDYLNNSFNYLKF